MKNLLILLILFPALALASGEAPRSQSADAYAREGVSEAQLDLAPAIAARTESRSAATAARSGCGCFEIYDVRVTQSDDRDGDGYHQLFRVEFDADTVNAHETVYAKLYLRRDYGPWMLFTETGLYDIHYDDSIDSYEVATRLLEGYPPGRYELRIDLYALYYSDVVATRTVGFDDRGDPLYLEDEINDAAPVEVIIITPDPQPGEVVLIDDDVHYAGSLTGPWLLLMAVLAGFGNCRRSGEPMT